SIKISYSPNKSERESISKLINNLDSSIALLQRKLEKMKNIKEILLNKMFVSGQAQFPEIRFKEFTNPWVQKLLGDMGDINGSTVDKVIRNEDIKCLMLNYMDVYNKKEIKKENLSFNSATPWQIYTNNILEGDVFITPSSETKYELGFAKTSNVEILNGVYSYHLIRFRPKNIKIEKSYLDYLFDTQKYRTYFSINGQGAQRFTLSLSFFKNAIIYLPSLKEQERIIKLLKTLDSSIALLQRKIEKLENIKSTLLNKMFV
ncbi:restriction endonuclease subunit S, partial [Mycoplasma sp. CSL7491-lung]|uniref:restriction endonuclease subunit S n=1 Tax=Mycoplasma sp. CSL7491-lung TaxID=549718 RepID=UPI001C124774